jgi:hypothetical protein
VLSIIKQEIRNELNRIINETDAVKKIYESFDRLNREVSTSIGSFASHLSTLDLFVDVLKGSFKPVVLFKGDMKLFSSTEDPNGKVYAEYAFAVRADEKLIINVQPDITIRLKSLTVLNGPYDVVECRIANLDILASSGARFTPGVEFPIETFEITPANRIFIQLAKR